MFYEKVEAVSHRPIVVAQLYVQLTSIRRPNVLVQVPITTADSVQLGRLGKGMNITVKMKKLGFHTCAKVILIGSASSASCTFDPLSMEKLMTVERLV